MVAFAAALGDSKVALAVSFDGSALAVVWRRKPAGRRVVPGEPMLAISDRAAKCASSSNTRADAALPAALAVSSSVGSPASLWSENCTAWRAVRRCDTSTSGCSDERSVTELLLAVLSVVDAKGKWLSTSGVVGMAIG